MLVGLVQLAYCDLTNFLLPKTMVHATTLAVAVSVVAVGAAHHDWHRAMNAGIGGAALFALLLAINLMNPKWMAFGDVRLAPAVGLGLGWINLTALFQGFLLANLLTAVVGITLMAVQRGRSKDSNAIRSLLGHCRAQPYSSTGASRPSLTSRWSYRAIRSTPPSTEVRRSRDSVDRRRKSSACSAGHRHH